MVITLGKIESVSMGIVESQIGIFFKLSFGASKVNTSKSAWDHILVECDTELCKWTEEDRLNEYKDIMIYISELLNSSKVSKIEDLKNVPIEATFHNNIIKSWRVLTEVL
jgi:hypothetical protein